MASLTGLEASVGGPFEGGQAGERGQRGPAWGQDVASLTGQEDNLSPEGFGLLGLASHQHLELPNILLVHTSPAILKRSVLDTQNR